MSGKRSGFGAGCMTVALLGVSAVSASPALARRVVVRTKQFNPVVAAGSPISTSGVARSVPPGARVALQTEVGPNRWRSVATARSGRNGRFKLVWMLPPRGRGVTMRVVVLVHGAAVASTRPETVLVESTPIPCAPATRPTSLPPGDGYIEGAVWTVGGPPPGASVCGELSETVTVAASSGAIVASQEVGSRQSYVFVLPAGDYTLYVGRPGICDGQASVTAGKGTHADTVCPVP